MLLIVGRLKKIRLTARKLSRRRERYKRALDAKKARAPSYSQEDAQARRQESQDENYVGTTYCAPNVKLTPAE